MKTTYLGHSCFSVEAGGKTILFDPFITSNPLAAAIDIGRLPADYILVSHGHDDHTEDAVAIAKRTGATVIANYEVGLWLQAKGAPKVHAMNHGGTVTLDFGRVKLVNAVHSSTMPDGSPGGHPAGFIVETGEGNFYYSGDTALSLDMKLIGESTKLKFAALCVGDYFTMGLDDALKDAHVDPKTYDATHPPAGVSADQQRAIAAAATRLGSQKTLAALAAVQQQARDVCHTPLSL